LIRRLTNSLGRLFFLLRNYRKIEPMLGYYTYFRDDVTGSFWGSLTAEEEQAVIHYAKLAGGAPGPIIEIGVLFGFTTQLIALHKPLEQELIGVEAFLWNPFGIAADHHREFTSRVLRCCTVKCNTRIFDGLSSTFYAGYKGESPAMVFIDADHEYEGVRADIAWAKARGVKIIAGHDYTPGKPGVVRAVDEAFGAEVVLHGSIWAHVERGVLA
jgi:hypothetical protein